MTYVWIEIDNDVSCRVFDSSTKWGGLDGTAAQRKKIVISHQHWFHYNNHSQTLPHGYYCNHDDKRPPNLNDEVTIRTWSTYWVAKNIGAFHRHICIFNMVRYEKFSFTEKMWVYVSILCEKTFIFLIQVVYTLAVFVSSSHCWCQTVKYQASFIFLFQPTYR